jgi:hypothetical protein
MVRYYFPFTEEQKKEFEKLVPEELQENSFLQRMFYADPEFFKLLHKRAEEKVREVIK